MTKPDFAALRAQRNAAVEAMIRNVHIELGGKPDEPVRSNWNPDACYCSCGSDENLCEHDFQGWREFDDGHGGEAFCIRCGLGAMSHSLRVGM